MNNTLPKSNLSFCHEPESKFMDGWFNNNRTNFGGKAMSTNDAINIHLYRPIQPVAKHMDNWFNGNNTQFGGKR